MRAISCYYYDNRNTKAKLPGGNMGKEIARFGVSIDSELLEKFDELISSKGYTNRSEAIRDATRRLVLELTGKNGIRAGLEIKRELDG